MDFTILKILFRNHFGAEAKNISALPPAGSNRKYYRMGTDEGITAIGTFNPDIAENKAFLTFSSHFKKKGLPVPEVYTVSEDQKYYLQEDLGDTSLKDLLDKKRTDAGFPEEIISYYKRSLSCLIRFQFEGHEGLDYSVCIPRDNFDARSILWDLNHFKYFFLKLSRIPYSEDLLENDFQAIATQLDRINRDNFMFRDFQSRNIMIKNNELYFIDYQGGRKGPPQYDLASILFEARANIPAEIRENLFSYYLSELSKRKVVNTDESAFREVYMSFALIRQLQAMGAYGLRGWIEGKPLFIQSIGYAVKNLEWIIKESGERDKLCAGKVSRFIFRRFTHIKESHFIVFIILRYFFNLFNSQLFYPGKKVRYVQLPVSFYRMHCITLQ